MPLTKKHLLSNTSDNLHDRTNSCGWNLIHTQKYLHHTITNTIPIHSSFYSESKKQKHMGNGRSLC